MKLVLLHVATAKEQWIDLVSDLYSKKISYFCDFEIKHIKPKKNGRDQAEQKKQDESDLILDNLKNDDFVILLDEKGKNLNSIEFSKKIDFAMSSGKKRIVFIIGGAYGVTSEVQKRSQLTICLSPMTLNHLMAQAVILEQIYRAFTIIKKIPYHNV